MTICYLIPGGLGSQLLDPSSIFQGEIWPSLTEIGLGGMGKMRLAPDGESPGSPSGIPLVAGEPVNYFYKLTIQTLEHALVGHFYSVRRAGYDWRKSFFGSGDALAARIRNEVTPGDPCAIVAHSFGGLVARRAWWSLKQSGEAGLVRRIITLGTPHQGTYSSVAAVGGNFNAFDLMLALNQLTVGVAHSGGLGLFPRLWSRTELRDLALTWPSLYEVFPLLGVPDAERDPNRALLYQRGSWPESVPISEAHLTRARDVVGPWLRDPATMPPSWVLTTVWGAYGRVWDSMPNPQLLPSVNALAGFQEGDGLITGVSARVERSAVYQVLIIHQDLPELTALSGMLPAWVLAIREEPDPVPEPVLEPTLYPITRGPAPLWAYYGGTVPPSLCGSGPCKC